MEAKKSVNPPMIYETAIRYVQDNAGRFEIEPASVEAFNVARQSGDWAPVVRTLHAAIVRLEMSLGVAEGTRGGFSIYLQHATDALEIPGVEGAYAAIAALVAAARALA